MQATPKHRKVSCVDSFIKKLQTAIKEVETEFAAIQIINNDFRSIQQETLDFALFEKDVERLYQKFQKEGSTILGSYLLLYDKQDLMELQIYRQEGDEAIMGRLKTTIRQLRNCPADIIRNLKQNGAIKLRLLADDIEMN